MKNRLTAIACAAGLLAMLSGCGAPEPIRYYTLLAPAAQAAAAVPATPLAIELLPITMPAQADMQQIVVRQGSDALLVLENERWIAPLAEEFRAALSADLTQRLGATEVTGLSRPAGAPVLRIKVDVRRFESEPGRHALVEAVWSVRSTDAGDERVALCTTQVRESIEAGVGGIVRGQQRAVAALGERIAHGVTSRAQGRAPACPPVER